MKDRVRKKEKDKNKDRSTKSKSKDVKGKDGQGHSLPQYLSFEQQGTRDPRRALTHQFLRKFALRMVKHFPPMPGATLVILTRI